MKTHKLCKLIGLTGLLLSAIVLTKTPEKCQAASTVSVQCKKVNSWESNRVTYSQWEFTVKNQTSKTITGWQVQIPISSGCKIDQMWNTKGAVAGKVLTCKAMTYNTTIKPGQSITYGGILMKAGSLSAKNAKVTYTVAKATTTPTTTTQSSSNNTGNSTKTNTVTRKVVIPKATADDWLHTKGNKIYNKNGTEVWLTGLNWFGYSTGTNCLDGLWNADMITSVQSIADKGFNLIRVPISSELLLQWRKGVYPKANYNTAINSYLNNKNSLQILDYFVGLCRANGIKIMFAIHCAKTDPMGHQYPLWYNGSISTTDYINSLAWLAKRYRKDDTVIAYDLKNEPHGTAGDSVKAIWNGSTSKNNWRYAAQKAALSVLKVNPNALVMVTGIEIYPKNISKNSSYKSKKASDYYATWWGGNLRGVKDYPIKLGKYQNKLVYTPHDYGPSVFAQPWFNKNYTYNSLMKDCWRKNWYYIHEQKIAPLLIGEWGGYMTQPNLKWMTYMRKLIKDNHISHTFWCYNANSSDTGGLVKDDFKTWDMEKYNFVKQVLWQSYGSFVGLDSQVPLGNKGITITQYEKQKKKAAAFKKITKATKPTISKLTKTSSTKVTLTWKKYKKAEGYVIYQSKKKSSGYTSVATVNDAKKTFFVAKNLKKKGTYYYKIRAYIKVGKKKVYSSYSVVKKVTLK